MKRRWIGTLLLASAISGCVNVDGGPETGGMKPNYGRVYGPPTVPGVEGPYGTKVPMAAPYNTAPPGSQYAAMRMMQNNVPMNMVQQNPAGMPLGGPPGMPMPPTMMPGGGMLSPPGMPAMPGAPAGGMGPFQQTSMQTAMPGGGGVMNANVPPGKGAPGGVTPAQFANSSPSGSMFPAQRTQVFFTKPAGMKVHWFTQGADGKPNYSATPLETPGRYNFAQAAIYRLKLTHIPGRPALELYPTLEVVPTSPKTNEFLAHNAVPIEFSEEDFKSVVDRNYLVKVIYLPDPQYQDAGGAGPEELVSTALQPGQDPIQEALRRGSILLVLRIGNIDQGLQHSPPTNAPIPGGPPVMMKPPGMGVMPGIQVPFPITPIAPGGMGAAPNTLPPLPGGNVPPVMPPALGGSNVPPLPGGNVPPVIVPPPGLKPDIAPPAKTVAPPSVPPFTIPGLNPSSEKPFTPPVPNPAPPSEKGASAAPINLPPIAPVQGTSNNPTLPTAPPGLPSLPSLEPSSGAPTLPDFQMPPPASKK